MSDTAFRKTTQHLAPSRWQAPEAGRYDIYPAFSLEGQIETGFDAFAAAISGHEAVILDGFVGVLWEDFRDRLEAALRGIGIVTAWVDVRAAMRPSAEIEQLVQPFLGGDDPIFGTRFTGSLTDFFDAEALQALPAPKAGKLSIAFGCGASLIGWTAPVAYLDVPKNEIQFRARAGSVMNLGREQPLEPKPAYKRFYFVDWPALAMPKRDLISRASWIVDAQRPAEPVFASGEAIRKGLKKMSRNFFRPRPWFEPGPWGGQWMKQRFTDLARDVPNYAWSFEAILPENGLMFKADGQLLEISFDCLMFQHYEEVLGECAETFRYEFPIRFDYLDTFDGGNLSVQCHPRPAYIRKHFGETFTQDETYYIFDAGPEAEVYLGFRDGVKPEEFRAALETSFREAKPLDVEQWVNIEPARTGDLFLIPNGTIHCSGKDTLVLEISATPYIFTFKMYDWMRLDLDGRPRPLNIDRAMENLYFERQGDRVREELISRPREIEAGEGWRRIHLPTHRDHFYEIQRLEFSTEVTTETDGSCHVLNLVEGQTVELETREGMRHRFSFAETFMVPAAAGSYTLRADQGPVKVVVSFMKKNVRL